MRYFWHAIVSIVALAAITFLFFIFSVNSEHRINFTDDDLDITQPTITIADPIQGPNNAAVTIVTYGDYQCEACSDMATALDEVIADYPDDIRIVWKDMPNTESHPEALNAAIAARCAGKQDQYFAYSAYLFTNRDQLGPDLYLEIANELKLKERTFNSCVENQETLPLVRKSFEEGVALDITATPTVFINGERYTGSLSANDVRAAVRPLIP